LSITALGRLAVGVGQQDSPLGIGITLHGTYGWPVIPGSSIKGMACAWAIENQLPAEQILRVFGAPRPHRTEDDAAPPDQPATAAPGIGQDSAEDDVASVGAVRFLDAQAAGVVPVARDVLTPHLQAYYRGADEDPADPGITREPPAEFRNPVPTEFLTVQGSGLEFALIGPEKDVDLAAKWCVAGFDELGIGGKTAAGYGYATITDVEL